MHRFLIGAGMVCLISACQTAAPAVRRIETVTPQATHTLAATITQTPAPASSGEPMPIGDLPGWRLIFSDDFSTPVPLGGWSGCAFPAMRCTGLPAAYRDRWWAYLEGWPDTSKRGVYSPSRVLSIENGMLDMHIRSEEGRHLVAGVLPVIHGEGEPFGQLYGRYAIRFKADLLPGYKIAWLLWPDSETWPRDGEIDFPEGELDGNIEAYLHHQDGKAPNDHTGFYSGVRLAGRWHTAVIEWLPESVRFILDGRVIGVAKDRIPNTPMHWSIQTETTIFGDEPEDGTEGHILIDWVAVYALE